MEFRFQYTTWECFYIAVKETIRVILRARISRVIIGWWLVFNFASEIMEVMSGQYDLYYGLMSLRRIFLVPATFFAFIIFIVFFQYLRNPFFRERDLCIRDGAISLKNQGQIGLLQVPCQMVKSVKVSGSLIWLELPYAEKLSTYILIPIRLFKTQVERDHFLEYFRDQQEITPILALEDTQQNFNAEWKIEYELEQDTWISSAAQDTAIRNIRSLGLQQTKSRTSPFVIFFLGIFFCITLLKMQGKAVNLEIMVSIVVTFAAVACVCARYERLPVQEESTRLALKYCGTKNFKIFGHWEVSFGVNGIVCKNPTGSAHLQWNVLKYLIETDEFMFFYSTAGQSVLSFEKAALGAEHRQQEFVSYCQTYGMEHKRITPMVDKATPRESKRKRFVWALGLAIFLFMMLHGLLVIGEWKQKKQEKVTFEDVETTPYVFRPEEYENYVPLDKQVAVLRSLGFEISNEMVAEQEEWLEDWPESRTWVEGYPYTSLLTQLGYPEWNTQTWEIESYSEQAYWFDFEGYDISSDYIHILEGINALSGGDFSFTEVSVDDSKANWERGSGELTIKFLLNETPCSYVAGLSNDWIDEGLVSYILQLVNKESIAGRLYAMGDDGQGCILLYRDHEWARKFERKTGLILKDH